MPDDFLCGVLRERQDQESALKHPADYIIINERINSSEEVILLKRKRGNSLWKAEFSSALR